ncbi:unnamed protein product [Eruca vesicaria subsp. sativa]|uniref:Uncharacterized protein n=1 Tax=Eruca vesicaria subsp. sativa TaxID=29727 RepID=A0ABC8K1Q9_ERUVS|nr:unnamed protein product [Eruca vesicaria subsp. sativa]
MGKELAEIREYECSEEDDNRYNGDQRCVCFWSEIKAMVKGEEAWSRLILVSLVVLAIEFIYIEDCEKNWFLLQLFL